MRKLILPIMISIDGYIAGPNDDMDWLVEKIKINWYEIM
jgi:hypothetical protein